MAIAAAIVWNGERDRAMESKRANALLALDVILKAEGNEDFGEETLLNANDILHRATKEAWYARWE